MRASYLGNLALIRLLIAHGADLDWMNSDSMTSLKWAAARGFTEICEALIAGGCDKQVTGGFNAADLAILNGFYETACYLHRIGVSPTKTSEEFAALAKVHNIDFDQILRGLEGGLSPRDYQESTQESEALEEEEYEGPTFII